MTINKIIIFLIKIYQITISPFMKKRCKFYPSCSEYCIKSIKKHGALHGTFIGLKRMLKCNPWSKGGYDDIA